MEVSGAGQGAGPVMRAIWRSARDPGTAFELQRLSDAPAEDAVMLDRLVESAIGAYLDARVHFTKQGVKSDLPAEAMATDIDALIAAAVFQLHPGSDRVALSPSTRGQLERLTRIDWSNARFGVDGGAEQDKYLAVYYYVRSQRQELERQLRADLLPLSQLNVLGAEPIPPGQAERINSTCGTVFDQENYLCALDLRMADTGGGAGSDPELAGGLLQGIADRAVPDSIGTASGAVPSSRIRKRDRWLKQELDAINQRIDRMDQRQELWELRDRMEDMEDRLTGLEIDMKDARARGNEENPSANLAALTGRNLAVRFGRNSTSLEPDQRVLLNEVFEQLARSPQDKVLITGYTDRSGDPARNLWLSEQRAKAVRGYLLSRGIDGDRLLVNYYGDSRSLGRDPGERRVELEWLR
ncbi:MAG: OmpA family protein [Flavobacteriales bacterium]|nr:OmpA family protein [Flavobacteriales bacterium]